MRGSLTGRKDSMDDCVFCKISDGKLPAKIVFEDDRIVAFWDANPASPVHILIVPRKHVPTLNDIPEGDPILGDMAMVARKIARDLGVAESGYRFFINVNRGGGQVVFHLHAHVIAGNDFGTLFIQLAIAFSIAWRKLLRLIGRDR
jgi:histidine triad (HIT) family protein